MNMHASDKEKILAYDRPVPRYTSYPTAPHFQSVSQKNALNWLTSIPEKEDISLYIHIPFCEQMCWYCGCHTKVTKRYEPIERYLTYVLAEITLKANMVGKRLSVSHIHFGGGSPGILHPQDFEELIEHLSHYFDISADAEIAIELDPRGVDEQKIKTYAKNGVNRVSLGVQDFNDTVLSAVNRKQPFDINERVVSMLRDNDINHISFDLMYGLPYQTTSTIEETMARAISLNPDRISFFGYAHVPWVKKHMRLMPEDHLPNKAERYDLFHAGAKTLKRAGYTSIGIDHFVKPGDNMAESYKTQTLRRNFQGYTTDTASTMIGFGASAISHFKQGYQQNSPDMPVYRTALEHTELPIKKQYILSADDEIRRDIIGKIMCYGHVDLKTYEEDFSCELERLHQYQYDGFIHIEDDVLHILKEHAMTARLIAASFDAYLPEQSQTPRHAQAV